MTSKHLQLIFFTANPYFLVNPIIVTNSCFPTHIVDRMAYMGVTNSVSLTMPIIIMTIKFN